jgi:hypothetical protein
LTAGVHVPSINKNIFFGVFRRLGGIIGAVGALHWLTPQNPTFSPFATSKPLNPYKTLFALFKVILSGQIKIALVPGHLALSRCVPATRAIQPNQPLTATPAQDCAASKNRIADKVTLDFFKTVKSQRPVLDSYLLPGPLPRCQVERSTASHSGSRSHPFNVPPSPGGVFPAKKWAGFR